MPNQKTADMKRRLDGMIDEIERVCDWRDDLERRWDIAVAQRWLADDELCMLEAEGQLIRRKMNSLAPRAGGCPGNPRDILK
jgi:hypothetical protein